MNYLILKKNQTNWIFGISLENDYEQTKRDSGNKYEKILRTATRLDILR